MTEDQQIRIAALPFAIELNRRVGCSLHDCDETDTCTPSQEKYDRYIGTWLDIISKSIKTSDNPDKI
jgi:hypothetical protein